MAGLIFIIHLIIALCLFNEFHRMTFHREFLFGHATRVDWWDGDVHYFGIGPVWFNRRQFYGYP